MAGRSQPTQLRALRGRAEGRDSGGRPLPEVPEIGRIVSADPPEWLGGDYAVALWYDAIGTLANLDMLKTADLPSLAVYCHQLSIYKLAAEDIAARGLTVYKVTTTADGDQTKTPISNPSLATASKAAALVRGYAGEFGFTPRAENVLGGRSGGKNEEAEDPFAWNG